VNFNIRKLYIVYIIIVLFVIIYIDYDDVTIFQLNLIICKYLLFNNYIIIIDK